MFESRYTKLLLVCWFGGGDTDCVRESLYKTSHYPLRGKKIQNSTGNNSPLGRWGVAKNTVNIYNWDKRFIMPHELAHTLGFWHEQSRSDRDSYIQINWANIQDGEADQFYAHNEANHYGPCDFDSVMLYGTYDFSANGLPTITVLPPYAPNTLANETI